MTPHPLTRPGPYVRPAPDNADGAKASRVYTVKDENGLCATVYTKGGRAEVWAQDRAAMSPYWDPAAMVEMVREWEAEQ